MKTILIITSVIFFGASVSNGQNCIGLNQSKILKKFGTPDSLGTNYIVYVDQQEEGTNTYYFDANNNCNAFVIKRASNYYANYQKLLDKNFTRTVENTFVCKSKKLNYKAELAQFSKEFQISITYNNNANYVQNILISND